MLKKQTKKTEITAKSVVTVTDGDTTKEVEVELYSCKINSDNPCEINISKAPLGKDYKEIYKANRSECRADYAAFEDAVYAIQDEMIAAAE